MRKEFPEFGRNTDQKLTAGDFRDATLSMITDILVSRFKESEWTQRPSMDEGSFRRDAVVTLSRTALSVGSGVAMQSGLWPSIRNTRFLADRFQRLKVDYSRFQIPSDGALTSDAVTRVEGDDLTEQGVDLTPQDVYLRSVSAYKTVTDETLEDYPGFQQMLIKTLLQSLMMRIDAQIIAGGGTEPDVLGIRNWSVSSQSKSSDSVLVATSKAAQKVYDAGYSPNLILLNPADWQAFVTTAAVDPFAVNGKVLGIDVFVSEASPSGLPTALDTSAAYFLERSPINLMMSKTNEDNWFMGQTSVRAEQRVAVAITDVAAVCKVVA